MFTVGAVLRGDDAAGPYLAKMMEEDPIEGWDVVDGGQMPENELSVIRRMQPDVLLLIDAAAMDEEPGTIKVLDEDMVMSDYMMQTHSLPLTVLLEQLKECCGTVVFLGIQPAQMEFMNALTPEVKEAVERIYNWLSVGGAHLKSLTGEE